VVVLSIHEFLRVLSMVFFLSSVCNIRSISGNNRRYHKPTMSIKLNLKAFQELIRTKPTRPSLNSMFDRCTFSYYFLPYIVYKTQGRIFPFCNIMNLACTCCQTNVTRLGTNNILLIRKLLGRHRWLV